MPTPLTRCPPDHDHVNQAKNQATSKPEDPTDVQIQTRKMTLQQQICSP